MAKLETLIERVENLEKKVHGILTTLEGISKHVSAMADQEIKNREALVTLSDNIKNLKLQFEEF